MNAVPHRAPPAPIQVCARCGAQWPVHAAPIQWCPRCRGVLLAPSRPDAPPTRRSFRWVARRPGGARRDSTAQPTRGPSPTPRYVSVPRWGLLDEPTEPQQPRRGRIEGMAWRAPALLATTGLLYLLAAAAELGRYLVLLHNRTRLIDPLVLAFSDATVWVFASAALVFAFVAALASVGWLVGARRAAFAHEGRSDPRQVSSLVAGCVIPVVNVVMPGVYLTELARLRGDRVLRAVRIWWCAWVCNAGMAVAALAWHDAQSLQVRANGVLFTATTDLVAAIMAIGTLWLLREVDGRDLLGRRRVPKRWLVATGPARPVIEPVQPANDDRLQEVVAK